MATTVSSQKALSHLKSIRPNDGWSIVRSDDGGMKLLRRSVPLSDVSFLDIHFDGNGNGAVVGVLTRDGSECQVLVSQDGKPVNGVQTVSVSNYEYKTAAATTSATASATRSSTTTSTTTTGEPLSDADKQLMEEYTKYALMAIGAVIALKVLASSMMSILVVLLPLLYLYGLSTCPPIETFDAKKELKRVLRGHHLPDTHPQKPKGVLEEWTARLTATVTTELATLPGYSVEMMPLGGAAVWTNMQVPTANLQCYWLGANHRWYYVGSRELEATTGTTTSRSSTTRPHQD
mmetsp:Transcript_25107/g.43961  ORF Transcript_25107/g.43961 Transcript_25107/m.43961 type:complete len:291 (-) Transcript_25107:271-1143(-)